MNHSITKNKKRLYYCLGIIFILLLWTILSLIYDNLFIPSILDVIKDIIKLFSTFEPIKLILLTILKLFLTILFGYCISLFLGILSYKFIRFRNFIAPIITMIRSVPVASSIIILILIIGTKFTPIIITLFVIIPIAYEAIYVSLCNCDKDIIEETKLVSNINLNIIFKVIIPMSSTYLIANLLSCVGLGLKVLVMGELVAQGSNTIGGSIQLARTTLETVRVFSWTIILLILVLIIEGLINYTKSKLKIEEQ